jgi:hypothetical protein
MSKVSVKTKKAKLLSDIYSEVRADSNVKSSIIKIKTALNKLSKLKLAEINYVGSILKKDVTGIQKELSDNGTPNKSNSKSILILDYLDSITPVKPLTKKQLVSKLNKLLGQKVYDVYNVKELRKIDELITSGKTPIEATKLIPGESLIDRQKDQMAKKQPRLTKLQKEQIIKQKKEEAEKLKLRDDVYELMRQERTINNKIGVVNQNSFILKKHNDHEFTDSELNLRRLKVIYKEIDFNKYFKYFTDNFVSVINYGLESIFSNDSILRGFGGIKFLYYFEAYSQIGKTDQYEVISNGFRYTHNHNIFNDNDTLLKFNYNIKYRGRDSNIVARIADEDNLDGVKLIGIGGETSDVGAIIVGYKVLFKTIDGTITEKTIYNLKAYHPSTDREYHEETSASTSTNNLCIYETFLDIIGNRKLLQKHNKNNIDDLLIMLDNEGDKIKFEVTNGNLINSLILLTAKYECGILVSFHKKDKYIIIKNGDVIVNPTEKDISEFTGQKAMLYDVDVHVAPFVFQKQNKIVKQNKKEGVYKLFPKTLVGKNNSVISIYGYDGETYLNSNKECVPYCLTLYGGIDDKIIKKVFYGEKCVDEFCSFIDSLSATEYYQKSRPKGKIEKIYIYGFNNSNFDNIFIYRGLHKLNPKTKFTFTNSSIKHIKYNNIRINDISLFHKCGSLSATCKEYEIEDEKMVFPYSFVNKDNLYYNGDVPELKYWLSETDQAEYILNNGTKFDMMNYTNKYCLQDSKLVYELAMKHQKWCIGTINNKKHNLMNANTSASFALKMFSQCFQKDVLTESPEKIIIKERNSYKGGRTEKFKNSFDQTENNKFLYHFDINSAHPNSMTKIMPYKYLRTIPANLTITESNIRLLTSHNLYLAKYKYLGNDEHNIPNLLLRKNGHLISVNETDEYSEHWGCELIEAIKNGYSVHIKEENEYFGKEIFGDYVRHFYKLKTEAKQSDKTALANFYKLLLNSLYGKFGQKCSTKRAICNSNAEVFQMLKDENAKIINFELLEDIFIIEYMPKDAESKSIGKLVRFSSYISALTRCSLSEMMRDVGHENVYYCATDSIHTSKMPSEEFISDDELGKWKKEHTCIKSRYIAPNSYVSKFDNGELKIRSKGFTSNKLDENELYDLCDGKTQNIKQEMTMFYRSLDNVKIENKERTMTMINNKRIWNGNTSKPFLNTDDKPKRI